MTLTDGTFSFSYIARASKGKKIHFFMCGKDGTPFKRSTCHHSSKYDEEDEVESLSVMQSIMADVRLCAICKKNIEEVFRVCPIFLCAEESTSTRYIQRRIQSE